MQDQISNSRHHNKLLTSKSHFRVFGRDNNKLICMPFRGMSLISFMLSYCSFLLSGSNLGSWYARWVLNQKYICINYCYLPDVSFHHHNKIVSHRKFSNFFLRKSENINMWRKKLIQVFSIRISRKNQSK